MDVQFIQNGKKSMRVVPKGMRRMLFFCIVFLGSLSAKAQVELVDSQFWGNWSFDRAQTQEKVVDSNQNYETQAVPLDDFWKRDRLRYVPTGINFHEGDFVAHISHPSWFFPVVAVMNEGKLEFRNFQPNPETDYDKAPDLSEIDSYPMINTAYELTLNGDRMILKSNYTYENFRSEIVEGILTVFYKK